MALATKHFISIPELEVAAGNRIAQMLKLPEGYTALVTSGAAGAMQSGLAGILTGDKEEFIRQLPDLTGMKSEVIIQRSHRNPVRPSALRRPAQSRSKSKTATIFRKPSARAQR